MKRDTDTEHGPPVVVVEIDSLGNFSASDTEENGATAIATGRAVSLERKGSFLAIRRFDEDEFEFPDLVKDSHALPHADDGFHVEVRRKEDNDPVGSNLREFLKQAAVVADYARFIADLEAGGYGGLV